MADSRSILPLMVQNLCYDAAGKRLLDDVTFTLPRGGITGIIGPNGSGKSLTLRLCHGLLQPSGGSIRWHGDGGHRGAKKHAMVFQRPVMLRRSARANIMHALAAVGAPDREDATRTALDRFGLSDLADHPARLMSGGEQQRLALARAWVLHPEVLLLDEPTSQLDPGATRQIEELVASLAAEGITVLMSTHDLGQARRLAQRILFFNRGRLIEDGPAPRFFAEPESGQARAFLAGDLLW